MKLNPYLNYNGDCRAAFNFYQQCLGGTVEILTVGESPMAEQSPKETHDRVMHGCFTVGDVVIMGADMSADDAAPAGFAITLNVNVPAEAERIFGALSEGGEIRMPIQETFWADRFGMFADRFGIPWMINCEKPNA